MKPLLSYQQSATILGVHCETVERYVRTGQLAAVRMGRRVLIREEDLEAFIDARRVAPSGAPVMSPVVWEIGRPRRQARRSA